MRDFLWLVLGKSIQKEFISQIAPPFPHLCITVHLCLHPSSVWNESKKLIHLWDCADEGAQIEIYKRLTTMELEKKIQADMVAAMKAKEAVKLASLRAIKAAIMLAKTAEGATGEVSDQDIVKIIQKLVKQRKESAQQYTDACRPELAANEIAEATEMEVYLPKQLSEEEVKAELTKIIAEVGASKPSDMGKVMGVATKRLAGLAEGRLISTLVKQLLA